MISISVMQVASRRGRCWVHDAAADAVRAGRHHPGHAEESLLMAPALCGAAVHELKRDG